MENEILNSFMLADSLKKLNPFACIVFHDTGLGYITCMAIRGELALPPSFYLDELGNIVNNHSLGSKKHIYLEVIYK